MIDLLIVSRKGLATITPNSDRGRRWIGSNIEGATYGDIIRMQSELIDDFVKLLQKDDITYEEL